MPPSRVPLVFDRAFMFLTRIEGLDLSVAQGLEQRQIDLACGDAKTKLPAELKASRLCIDHVTITGEQRIRHIWLAWIVSAVPNHLRQKGAVWIHTQFSLQKLRGHPQGVGAAIKNSTHLGL